MADQTPNGIATPTWPDVVLQAHSGVELTLERAILIYGRGTSMVYASAHTIEVPEHEEIFKTGEPPRKRRSAPVIGPGVPLTRKSVADLAEALGAAVRFAGFVPTTVLYTGPDILAWWCPAQTRPVYFRTDKDPAGDQPDQDQGDDTKGRAGRERLANRSGPAPHPALIFAATGREWFVRAAADLCLRPTPQTKLHRAPYFNVWESGRICTGNVRLPERLDTSTLVGYEDAFFNSRFTHPNTDRLVKYPGGAYTLWADMLDHATEGCFPQSALIPLEETLEDWIDNITKGNHD